MRTITINVPAKLVVSENGAAPNQLAESAPNEIGKLLKVDTPLIIWLLFFTIGGGILALYYARIGYLPEMEWKAALVYLFVGTMIGGTLGLLLTISLFIPGVIWSELIIFDPDLDQCMSYDVKEKEQSGKESLRKEVCMRSLITYLGFPFLVALLLSHLALWARLTMDPLKGEYLDLYWFIIVLLLFVTFCVMRSLFGCVMLKSGWSGFWSILKRNPIHVIQHKGPALKDDQKPLTDDQQRRVFKCAFWFTLAVLLNQISMYVIYRLSGSPQGKQIFIVLTVLCTAGVAISTHAVAALYRQHPRKAVVASLVAAVLLLFTEDHFSSLSVRVMNHFGLGYSQKYNFRVNDDGAKTVRELNLKCGESYYYLCDVEILSKMGDQYFLKVGSRGHLTLPKSEVVFIQRLDQALEPVERTKD